MDHKIKVLFLDIDNTLLDFDAGAAWAMNLCFEKQDFSTVRKCLWYLKKKIIKSGVGLNSGN